MSRISERNNKPKKKFHQRKGFLISIGIIIGVVFVAALYQTSVYFSTNESCMMCHVHPHAEESWQLSVHVNNGSGVTVNCVDCHLPPSDNTWAHYSAKAVLGARELWGYLTKDSADFNWDQKSELEYAIKYIPNESCVKCHQNLFPEGITDDGITAHLYYDDNVEKLDLQCISCHLDAGHYIQIMPMDRWLEYREWVDHMLLTQVSILKNLHQLILSLISGNRYLVLQSLLI